MGGSSVRAYVLRTGIDNREERQDGILRVSVLHLAGKTAGVGGLIGGSRVSGMSGSASGGGTWVRDEKLAEP